MAELGDASGDEMAAPSTESGGDASETTVSDAPADLEIESSASGQWESESPDAAAGWSEETDDIETETDTDDGRAAEDQAAAREAAEREAAAEEAAALDAATNEAAAQEAAPRPEGLGHEAAAQEHAAPEASAREPAEPPLAESADTPAESPAAETSERSEAVQYGSLAEVPGHGDARHGSHVTEAQHLRRLTSGIAPDGEYAPTDRSTSFHSDELHLECVNKLMQKVHEQEGMVDCESIPVGSNGEPIYPRAYAEVTTDAEGGWGWGMVKGENGDVRRAENLRTAAGIVQWNPETEGFTDNITQHPVAPKGTT